MVLYGEDVLTLEAGAGHDAEDVAVAVGHVERGQRGVRQGLRVVLVTKSLVLFCDHNTFNSYSIKLPCN